MKLLCKKPMTIISEFATPSLSSQSTDLRMSFSVSGLMPYFSFESIYTMQGIR